VLPESSIVEVVRALRTELAGLGVLEVLVAADGVTDVLVNGPDQVWVDAGEGLTRTDVRFPDEGAVRRLAQRLAGSVGRRLDDSVPYVDARLPTGIRLHAVLPPISGQGTCISLRVPRRRVFTLADLAEVAMVPPDGVEILAGLVARRAAFLVSGGTGQWQDHASQQPAVRVDPRRATGGGRGLSGTAAHTSARRAVGGASAQHRGVRCGVGSRPRRQALRMRPDRVVVGEVRGRRGGGSAQCAEHRP
jgi:pilus assembly protein CpaF